MEFNLVSFFFVIVFSDVSWSKYFIFLEFIPGVDRSLLLSLRIQSHWVVSEVRKDDISHLALNYIMIIHHLVLQGDMADCQIHKRSLVFLVYANYFTSFNFYSELHQSKGD